MRGVRKTIAPLSWAYLLSPHHSNGYGTPLRRAWRDWSSTELDHRNARYLAVCCMRDHGWPRWMIGEEMSITPEQVKNLESKGRELLEAETRREHARLRRVAEYVAEKRRLGHWLHPTRVGIRSIMELEAEDAWELRHDN